MEKYWVKAFGSAGERLADDWRAARKGVLQGHATFGQNPKSVGKGDGIVYYAAGTGLVFAAGTVTSFPYPNATNSPEWPFRVDVSLEVAKDYVHEGIRLEDLNRPTSHNDVRLRIKRRSHVQLTLDEYKRALTLLKA
jgi:hypothetical protein